MSYYDILAHANVCRSVAAGTGGVIGPHYASSKSAMHGLLHWIASRYAKDGVVSLLMNVDVMCDCMLKSYARR